MQPAPTPTPTPTPSSPPINIHVDLHLDELAGLIWQWVIDHIGTIGWAIITPLEQTMRSSGQALWNAAWTSSANIVTQLPPDLTYNFGPYRAIATNPIEVALGGTTLAVVLLGLRTMIAAMTGRDNAITHVLTRLIPAVFLCLAYGVLIAQGVTLFNDAARGLGSAPIGSVILFPSPPTPALILPYTVLWVLMLYYGLRLLIRMISALFRFIVALVFGPLAIILWAIPQTEWITQLWLRELLGWGTSPLLVTACLAIAIPMASGGSNPLAAFAFGIAGLQAAYDMVGLLGYGRHQNSLFPMPFIRQGMGAAGGGAAAAAAAIPQNQMTTWAEQFGFQ